MMRYFYYMVIMCMMINVMLNVPTILIEKRFDGAVMAIIAAILSGGLCTIVFIKSLKRFPNLGLPEIFRAYPVCPQASGSRICLRSFLSLHGLH